MRTFRPKIKSSMTDSERKKWRAKWITRLNQAGIPMSELLGIADHALWQMKNRRFGEGQLNSKDITRPKKSQYL